MTQDEEFLPRVDSEMGEAEEEMSSVEQSQLVSVLASKVDSVVDAGIMTSSEGQGWVTGGWACEKREYLENLIRIIDSFIASGEARKNNFEALLLSDVFTSADRSYWRGRFESSSYPGKKEVIREMEKAKEAKERERAAALLAKSKELARDEEAKSQTEKAQTEEAKSEPKPEVQAIPGRNPKTDCLDSIEVYLSDNQFGRAREILSSSQKLFSLAEYIRLSRRIDKSELSHLGIELAAA